MDPRFREGDERSTKASVAGTASAPFAHSRPAGPCRGGRRAMCHEMSCFVMVPYVHGSYPAVGPGMKLSFRSGFRALRPVLSVGVSRMGLSSRSRFVPSVPPSRSCGGSLFRAYRVCAAGPSAPARFARLIARARRRTHPSRPFPPGYATPDAALLRRKGKRAAPEAAFLSMPILARFSPSQAPRRAKP